MVKRAIGTDCAKLRSERAVETAGTITQSQRSLTEKQKRVEYNRSAYMIDETRRVFGTPAPRYAEFEYTAFEIFLAPA